MATDQASYDAAVARLKEKVARNRAVDLTVTDVDRARLKEGGETRTRDERRERRQRGL